jgi:hypothetical protein
LQVCEVGEQREFPRGWIRFQLELEIPNVRECRRVFEHLGAVLVGLGLGDHEDGEPERAGDRVQALADLQVLRRRYPRLVVLVSTMQGGEDEGEDLVGEAQERDARRSRGSGRGHAFTNGTACRMT